MAKFESDLNFGDQVVIDGHAVLVGRVIAFDRTDDGGHMVKVSWWERGNMYDGWFARQRLNEGLK